MKKKQGAGILPLRLAHLANVLALRRCVGVLHGIAGLVAIFNFKSRVHVARRHSGCRKQPTPSTGRGPFRRPPGFWGGSSILGAVDNGPEPIWALRLRLLPAASGFRSQMRWTVGCRSRSGRLHASLEECCRARCFRIIKVGSITASIPIDST